MRTRTLLLALAAPCLWACAAATSHPEPAADRLDVRIVTDEADAVAAILQTRARGVPPAEEDFQRLFASEGYRRLNDRERAFQRGITDSAFRAFVLSDTLFARHRALLAALRDWKRVDPRSAAEQAFAYLPEHAVIRARIYPMIKPRTNSFVWETRTNPAIFMYVDPAVSAAKFENTLAHELHHIGTASACRDGADSSLAPGVRAAREWMTGFAEGRAVLAAAGSPDIHPHASSSASERAVWDRDVARVADDIRRLESFFLELLEGRLTEEEANRRGFRFVATDSVPQGAFYTVGWFMSAAVERALGRQAVVATLCSPARFLADYNRVARAGPTPLPRWSDSLLALVDVPR